jgi:hypothetical protein
MILSTFVSSAVMFSFCSSDESFSSDSSSDESFSSDSSSDESSSSDSMPEGQKGA